MKDSIKTFFKILKNPGDLPLSTKMMDFGNKNQCTFNYVDFLDPKMVYVNNKAFLAKEMNDSFVLSIDFDTRWPGQLEELKLTNQRIHTWEDLWLNSKTSSSIDPKIKRINLQKNELVHANFNLPRRHLVSLNLEGNKNLRAVFIAEALQLEVLNVSNCPRLEVFNLGQNKNIKAILAKNSQMPELVMERLLRDFTPTVTSSSNVDFSLFKKHCDTLLDLRGNEVVWGNRRIASKIRLLLCNNWVVLWDNMPPTSIVPPQMYSFFTSNIQEALIKDYYG